MTSPKLFCASTAAIIGLLLNPVTSHARRPSAEGDSADVRAQQMLDHLTLQQKLSMVFTVDGGGTVGATPIPPGGLGSAGYLKSPTGLPALQIADAGLGLRNPSHIRPDGQAVELPSGLAIASTWSTDTARQGGSMIGGEAWHQGFNVLLAGGANLTRDPRGGRNFEYAGEDPLLTGKIVGATISGIQSQNVISTLKHYAMNDLETSRMTLSADIDNAAMRESDLLAFEIAVETGHPGAVMCAYNRVNDIYACENPYLLTTVLKDDWKYPGFVMSDWGGTRSSFRAALAGLDQESAGDSTDTRQYFRDILPRDVQQGRVPISRVDDMARRIIRSMYAVGLVDHPHEIAPLDVAHDMLVSQQTEEKGAVLLKNQSNLLPLDRKARIAVIGGHADVGILSGGGSTQVDPIGAPPEGVVKGPGKKEWPGDPVYFPSSPLAFMREEAPSAHITFDSGTNITQAIEAAQKADVAVVFVTQYTFEGSDAPNSMRLDGNQDALVAAVAHANPHTVVVMETGDPILMPWLPDVGAVLEAWYPGSAGGHAIARLLYGTVAPSGHLPMTFPAAAAQLAHPDIAGDGADTVFQMQFRSDQEVIYDEGSEVGYRWFDRNHAQPLFPFGYGLTYTTFQNDGLHLVQCRHNIIATFTVRNTGSRAGIDVPQIYVRLPDGGGRRLAGWNTVTLAPGESKGISVPLDPRILARFDAKQGRWNVASGHYTIWLASSSGDNSDSKSFKIDGFHISH
ncbi:MAG: glycoside hydrolase family 3 C-terminal domain-containing protein [Komagataeibacter rhaeticus]|nr:glycoside hydrolase family 3 C-terminal domain-containing protein [Komagataeibacter rhaeticus]